MASAMPIEGEGAGHRAGAFLVGEWGTTRERRVPRGPANLEEPPGSAYKGNIPLHGTSAFRSLFQLNTGIAPRCRSDPLHSTSFPEPNTPLMSLAPQFKMNPRTTRYHYNLLSSSPILRSSTSN